MAFTTSGGVVAGFVPVSRCDDARRAQLPARCQPPVGSARLRAISDLALGTDVQELRPVRAAEREAAFTRYLRSAGAEVSGGATERAPWYAICTQSARA